MSRLRFPALLAAAFAALLSTQSFAAQKDHFRSAGRLCGWMRGIRRQPGIVDKCAKKYGSDRVCTNDYVESINQYTLASLTAAP